MDVPTELRALADQADAALSDENRDRQLIAEGLIDDLRRLARQVEQATDTRRPDERGW